MSLISELKKIQTDWAMSLPELSRLAHVDETSLEQFFQLSDADVAALPTVPAGMEGAVALLSVMNRLGRLYPQMSDREKWLATEHPDFGNQTPAQTMMSSPDHLAWVSYYLASKQ